MTTTTTTITTTTTTTTTTHYNNNNTPKNNNILMLPAPATPRPGRRWVSPAAGCQRLRDRMILMVVSCCFIVYHITLTYVYIYALICVYIYIYTHMCVYIYDTCVHIYIYVYVYIYIYIYMYTTIVYHIDWVPAPPSVRSSSRTLRQLYLDQIEARPGKRN